MNRKIIMLLDNPFISDSRVEKEINSLVEAGFFVDLICEIYPNLPSLENRGNLTIHRTLTPLYKKPFHKDYNNYLLEVAKYILIQNGVAIHCHDYHMLNIGLQVKQLSPFIKLVYDSHEYLKGWPIYKASKSKLNKLKGFFVWKKNLGDEALGIKKSDKIFTVTKGISDQFQNDHKLEELPEIVRNFPVNTHFDFSNNNYFIEKYKLHKEIIVAVHSGNIYMNDNTCSELMDYIASKENLVLIFMGNKPRFVELKERYSNFKNVFFHEYNDQKRNIELMSSADIGLCYVNLEYKSHYLTSANRYMEYSYAGLAIFSSGQKEIEKLNQEMGNTIFFKKDAKSIIQCFENITEKEISLLKTNSKEKAFNYIWENESEKLINYYSNL